MFLKDVGSGESVFELSRLCDCEKHPSPIVIVEMIPVFPSLITVVLFASSQLTISGLSGAQISRLTGQSAGSVGRRVEEMLLS